MKTIHAIIFGKVQGVFFRDSTRKKALELSISGWVRNNSDGTVELEATGEESNLTVFCQWLHQGSTQSHVDNVSLTSKSTTHFTGFVIR